MPQTEQYRRVGKFELHEIIGEGAMGAVWRAYDSVIRRFVALKLLSRAGRSADAQDRFMREARAAGALQHPNIVTVYDLGESDEQLFIRLAEVVDRDDVGVLQRPSGARLPHEAILRVGRAARAGQQLEGHEAPNDGVVRPPHGAHGSLADD